MEKRTTKQKDEIGLPVNCDDYLNADTKPASGEEVEAFFLNKK